MFNCSSRPEYNPPFDFRNTITLKSLDMEKAKNWKEKTYLLHTNNNGSGSGRPKSNESSWSRSGTGPRWIPTQIHTIGFNCCWIGCSVADPDSGSGTFLTPGSRMGKKSGFMIGDEHPRSFSESLGTVLGLRMLKFFDADPGSEIVLILDRGSEKFGSGINIRDLQHWIAENRYRKRG